MPANYANCFPVFLVSKTFWIDIKMMSTVGVNGQSMKCHKWFFCDVNYQHQIDINYYHQIDVAHGRKQFNQTFFFNQPFLQPKVYFINFICQYSFSRHIRDIILTSCVDGHMIFAIWYQQCVKIRSIDVVPWYWPTFYIKLSVECPLE